MNKGMKLLSVRVPSDLLTEFESVIRDEMLRVPDVVRSLIAEYVREKRSHSPSFEMGVADATEST